MNIQTLGEHSIDVDLLSGGDAIDVGCLGFGFSKAVRDLGCSVIAFDVADMVAPEGIAFTRKAVMDYTGVTTYFNTRDEQARYLGEGGDIEISTIALNDIYSSIGENVDVLKLDCEGSEYFILSDDNFKPIPKQITVEFHYHCHKGLHEKYYDRCMENLLKHYDPVQHNFYEAHGAGFNFWDSLFILKQL